MILASILNTNIFSTLESAFHKVWDKSQCFGQKYDSVDEPNKHRFQSLHRPLKLFAINTLSKNPIINM